MQKINNMSVNNNKKNIVITGIQPTGRPHIGNYFGAMKPMVDLQDMHDEIYIFVADYHALTTINDKEKLQSYINNLILDYLAVGIDPEKVCLYRQSDIPALTELTWIFSNLVTVPWLERAHAFKDKVQQGKEAGVGLFNYPILMAADILLPKATLVPVGKDQIQHIEMTREIARKFNAQYDDIFPEPQEEVSESVMIVPGTDGQKMSKSYNNTIPLFGNEGEIKKAVMGIVTDSKGKDEPKDPDTCNVFALHTLISSPEYCAELRTAYTEGTIGYGDAKKQLLANLNEMTQAMKEKRAYYENNPGLVRQILDQGARVMQKKSQSLMTEVYQSIGLA
jgi:tryptophanyl-tRNA synthetase